jgi:hypothetical protein
VVGAPGATCFWTGGVMIFWIGLLPPTLLTLLIGLSNSCLRCRLPSRFGGRFHRHHTDRGYVVTFDIGGIIGNS